MLWFDILDTAYNIKNEGFLLVNATYKQVNKLRGKIRDYTVLSDYNRLIDETILPKERPWIICVFQMKKSAAFT
jgi:hypothetical protein